MKHRKRVLVAVLVLMALPAMLAVAEAVSFRNANRNNGMLISAGAQRAYLLYVPSSYRHDRATPLVISLHGAAMWPAAQREISQWNRLAEEHGFIVVYPSGIAGNGPNIWHVDGSGGRTDDVRFISELIDTLQAVYNVDPARIYANGMSNGGGMAFVLSCALPDRMAAVGMVAAAQTLPWSWCQDVEPVAMIAFHGTADPVVPYHGGPSWISRQAFPSVLTWTANWARRNHCASTPIESVIAPDVTRLEYPDCAGNADVVLYSIQGGGHTWPGGQPLPHWFTGHTSNSMDATSQIWQFFIEHKVH